MGYPAAWIGWLLHGLAGQPGSVDHQQFEPIVTRRFMGTQLLAPNKQFCVGFCLGLAVSNIYVQHFSAIPGDDYLIGQPSPGMCTSQIWFLARCHCCHWWCLAAGMFNYPGMMCRPYIADFLLKNYGFSSLSEKIFLGGGAKECEAVKLGCVLRPLLNEGFPPWILVRFLFPIIRHSLQVLSTLLSPRAGTHPLPQEFCHYLRDCQEQWRVNFTV